MKTNIIALALAASQVTGAETSKEAAI
jgi:hypothetical protein